MILAVGIPLVNDLAACVLDDQMCADYLFLTCDILLGYGDDSSRSITYGYGVALADCIALVALLSISCGLCFGDNSYLAVSIDSETDLRVDNFIDITVILKRLACFGQCIAALSQTPEYYG